VKILLSKKRTIQEKDIACFDMPLLDSNVKGGAESLSFNQNIEKIEREAYESGFETGEKAGLDMGMQKAAILIEKLETILAELVTLREKLIKESEPQLVELAVSIAKKIILKELTLNPEEIVKITKEALMKIERVGQITIKITPSLYDLFNKLKPELLSIHPDIIFDVDPSISKYGSVVMGPFEDVLTDVDEQLRNLIKDIGDGLK
jgi:flagellar assembly protein FliH